MSEGFDIELVRDAKYAIVILLENDGNDDADASLYVKGLSSYQVIEVLTNVAASMVVTDMEREARARRN